MRGLFIFVAASVLTPSALAGPWGQDDGEWYGRVAFSAEQIDGTEAYRLDLYGEYGLNDDWTVIAKSEAVTFPQFNEFDAHEERLVVQRRLWSFGRFTTAAGGGVVYSSAIAGIEGCDTIGGEARASIGATGSFGERDWYASADISGRWHEDGCQRQKLDLVLGYDWYENFILSPQIYIERGNRAADSDAVQIELIRDFGRFDLALGYKYEAGEAFTQNAVLLAISSRF